MRIAYFGSGAFGLPTLQSLAARHEVVTVVSQPDRPAGRGGKSTPTPISSWASENSLPLLRPENVNVPDTIAHIQALNADAWVVIAFGQKLSNDLLHGQRALNLHASLLPRWRGAAPIHAAILAGDTHTGNSVITLASTMDAGLILEQSKREILPAYTTEDLHDILSKDGPNLIESCLARAMQQWPFGTSQDTSQVTRARKLSKDDGWIDLSHSAVACRNRIHGLNPWPTVTVSFRDEPLKVLRAAVSDGSHSASPGAIVDPMLGTVACGEGSLLQLLDVQAPGKRVMTWREFATGRQPRTGELIRGKE